MFVEIGNKNQRVITLYKNMITYRCDGKDFCCRIHCVQRFQKARDPVLVYSCKRMDYPHKDRQTSSSIQDGKMKPYVQI